jgi:uncharacterized protein (DUF1810 family)
MSSDPFNLARFVDAQAAIYPVALTELKAGAKQSHWMWFIFPQMRGLGTSSAATFYGIGSLDEAQAYLAHAILGPRLRECTAAVLSVTGRSLPAIFGAMDAAKFRSSMTLFDRAGGGAEFRQALDRFCDGEADGRTLDLISQRF